MQQLVGPITQVATVAMMMRMMSSMVGGGLAFHRQPPAARFETEEAEECLARINRKWRELDELQIATHFKCMSPRKWAVLNSLDAIGLELTRGYPAIGSYIDERMETIERALRDLKFDKEVI